MITRLRQALGAALLLLLAGAASAQQTTEAAEQPGEIALYVFDGGRPVEGLRVRIGDASAVTDETGGVFLQIPPGRRDVVVSRDGEQLLNLDLLTAEGENVQVLVTLRGPGQPPEVDIESSAPDKTGTVQAAGGPRDAAENRTPGLLRGRVLSVEQGEPVANARIFFAGVDTQVRTNARGEFQAELPAGNYSLSVIHEDFATQTVDNVRVIPQKEVTTTIELTPAGVQLQEYVVTAPYIEGSVASAITEQRETSGVSEVLGADQMSKAGDSDAAEALQRVTGLTIEDGKYVVIRGQPSRYTFTQWNGSRLPSPDPLRQVVPLNLFPTGVLSSITVQKSYTPDRPGAFGAGLVALDTVSTPEEPFAAVSASTGFNTESTGEDGLSFDGGDELTGDGDDLSLPGAVDQATQGGSQSFRDLSQEQINELGRAFDHDYALEDESLQPDQGLSASAGTTMETGFGDFGVLGAFSWSRKERRVEEIDRQFRVGNQPDELAIDKDFVDRRTDLDIELGGLLALSGEWESHKLSTNTFFIRETTKRAEISEGRNDVSGDRYERNFLLEWNQREMLINQIIGEHDFDFVQLDWRYELAQGDRESPNRRTYTLVRVPSTGEFLLDEDTGVRHRFNEVEDDIVDMGVDLTFPVIEGEENTLDLKAGIAHYNQERTSNTQRFQFQPDGSQDLSQDVEEIVNDDTIGNGVEFSQDTLGTDDFRGEATVEGAYLMADTRLFDVVRAVGGVRRESADFDVRTFEDTEAREPIVSGFSETRLLPAISLTGFLPYDMQLRASFSKTVSRPLLVEISRTTFFDPDTGEEFVGNEDLKPAKFENYDLRWEWYPSSTESLTAGVFYKEVDDPIERQFNPLAGGGEQITFQNAENGTVRGVELGGRTGLGWIAAGWLENAYVQANVALIDSEVDLEEGGVATNTSRAMTGQADRVLNLQLGYNAARYDATLSLNHVGERLDRAGVQGEPDVFQEPITYLDFATSYKPWPGISLKFTAENLLDAEEEFTQGDRVERAVSPGTTYGLSVTWRPFSSE